MLESDLERRLVAYCYAKGLLTYKFTSPAHRGVPDRIICGGGKVLFLEIKMKGGKPTALQERELHRLRQAGMEATWADNWATIQTLIDSTFHLP